MIHKLKCEEFMHLWESNQTGKNKFHASLEPVISVSRIRKSNDIPQKRWNLNYKTKDIFPDHGLVAS